MDSERPNILWFCTDQQRFDTVGALGNPHIRTPSVDRLVREGTAFTRCYVQNPICTPSRASFLTGRYPAAHGVYRNGNAYFPAHEVPITRHFADAGYHCGLIGKLHLTGAQGGYERRVDDGYHLWQWSFMCRPEDGTSHNNAYHHWLRAKGVDPFELFRDVDPFLGPGVPAAYHQTRWIGEASVDFIEAMDRGAMRGQPWLLSVNPFAPHHPFDPSPEYLERIDPARLPLPLFRESDLERQKMFMDVQHYQRAIDPRMSVPGGAPRQRLPEGGWSQHHGIPERYDARAIKAAYYAMIEQIDDALATILDALERTGQHENTIVIFTSDHGELLGDHGLLFKGARFFEGAVRVPLVMRWPAGWGAGRQSPALVESIDIAPTLLEAAGLSIPERVQGRTLGPILTGIASPETHKDVVLCDFNDSIGRTQTPISAPTRATMSFDGRHKLIVYHDKDIYELFDLAEDPGEFVNLWYEPGTEDLCRARLARHMDAIWRTIDAGPPRVSSY